ncbi:MAG: hypothetical protein NTU58_00715 [Candidatus Nealsonbacteria bacterium]|nr:hypothetical protein [Candidatus Nealsonbacteria bacterium]
MNKFKVFFISIFLISAFFFAQEAGAIVQTKSTQELEALIKSLQLQIEQLQKQLEDTKTPIASVWCHNFNVNLKYGDKGDEVEVLQVVLEKEGFQIDNSEKKPFATFGEFTASALVGLQDKYFNEILKPLGLQRGTGFMGKATREKLNKTYGCGASFPITPTTPATPATPAIPATPAVPATPAIPATPATPAVPATPAIQGGLIAYWKFDEGAGSTAYDSAGINNGKVYNASWVNGVYGKALELKGKGVVSSIPDSFDNSISDSFTITNQIYWYGPNEYNRSSYIFDNRSAGAGIQRYGFIMGIYRDTERVFLQLLCPPDDNSYMTVVSLHSVPRNIWTSITGVFDLANGKLSLYINGVLDNSVPVNHAYCKASGSPAIGNNRWSAGDGQYAPLNGIIDELKIYGNKNIIPNEKYITVLAPNGGEILFGGQNYTIKWKSSGVNKIKIAECADTPLLPTKYTCHELSGIPSIGIDASLGSFNWYLDPNDPFLSPYIPSSLKIKIWDATNPSLYDQSDNYFTAFGNATSTNPYITVLAPNGGETFYFGKTFSINWISSGITNAYLRFRSPDGLLCKIADVLAKEGKYSFLLTEGMKCSGTSMSLTPGKWKISILSELFTPGGYGSDDSDNYFDLVSSTSTSSITSFNYTETDAYNGSVKFYWTNNTVDKVELKISCHSGLSIKNAVTGADFACGENNIEFSPNSYAYLKFTNTSGSPINATAVLIPIIGGIKNGTYSKTINFTIVAPYITVITPNGGENWTIGSTYNIKWNAPSNAVIRLDLINEQGGLVMYNLVNVTGNPGSAQWQIPSYTLAGRYLLKAIACIGSACNDGFINVPTLTACTNSNCYIDYSDSYFSILAVSPTGSLPVITSISPNQSAKGNIIDLIITGYNFTGAGNYSGCGISPVSDRGFGLVSCNQVSDTKITARFSISSSAEEGMRYIKVQNSKGQSNSMSFNVISPYVTVISPNGAEEWKTGSTKRVSWTASGLNYVRIYIEDDTISGSGSINYIYDGVINANQGYYDWTIVGGWLPGGDTLPRNYKIRIDGVNTTTEGAEVIAMDHSDELFNISSSYYVTKIVVVSPNGGEKWTKGTAYPVQVYCSQGISSPVDIWLLDQEAEGGTVVQIASSVNCTSGNTYQYQWTIPSFIYPRDGSFKVYARTIDGTFSDQSDYYFSIVEPREALKSIEKQLADISAKIYELAKLIMLMKK